MSVDQPTDNRTDTEPDATPARAAVDEQPWDHDWRNYDPEREPGDETPDGVLLRKKKRKVARDRNISFSEADHLVRTGEAEVDDAEVV